MAFLAAAAAIGSIAKGVAGAIGANQASHALQSGYNNVRNEYQTATAAAQKGLNPYTAQGASAAQQLQGALPGLATNFSPTVAGLDQTPGYQFMQQQGENAINNAMAAQGLAGSGAEMKALNNYTQANALQQYGTLAKIYNQGRTISGNMLMNATRLGQGAATQSGQFGMAGAGGIANALLGHAQAKAAGVMGVDQAIGGMISNGVNAGVSGYMQGQMLGLGGGGMGGGGGLPVQPAASSMGGMGTV